MDHNITWRIFSILLFAFIIAISIRLFLSLFLNSRLDSVSERYALILEALDEELPSSQLESYKYCFENARTVKPAQEKWTSVPDPCLNDVDMAIMVKSSTDRNENRRIIRKTWGQSVQLDAAGLRLNIRVIFVIGFSTVQSLLPINLYLQAENRKYKDILQIDVQDGVNIHHSQRKTLNGLEFINKFCPNVSMILITDDDTVLAPWLLFGQIIPIDDIMKNSSQPFFGGVPYLMNIVPRQIYKTSRMKIRRDVYPCYSMPKYLQAFAMLISQQTLKLFLEETESYYSSVFLDDIYLSWLAYRLNLTFFEFPKQLFDGSCLEDNSIQVISQDERHTKIEGVEQIAIFHQCDFPRMQIDLWQRLCESFIANETIVLKMHTLYCDAWLTRVLM